MIRIGHPIFLTVILFVFVGCNHLSHYVPDPSSFKLEPIKEFTSQNAVSIVNAQTSSEDVLWFGSAAYANYQAWTDSAIEIARRELSARGMDVTENADRLLKLSVVQVKGIMGVWRARCWIDLLVETGNGYKKTYRGDSLSSASHLWAADGALMQCVAEMLRDEIVVEYLTK